VAFGLALAERRDPWWLWLAVSAAPPEVAVMNPHPFDVSAPEAGGSAQRHLIANWNGRRFTRLSYWLLLAGLIAVLIALEVISARVT
jgi:hypothetical protein